MYNDLLQLGGIPNKSLLATWHAPPPEFLRHFVRGFIDGDGCLYWLKTATKKVPYIQAVGTAAFLRGLASAIEQITGIPAPASHPSENISKISWSGLRAKCLANWLYEDCGLCLERKRSLAQECSQWQPPGVIRRKTITPNMRELFGHLLPE
jgi:hypothetical protein